MEPWIVVGWETGINEKNGREWYRVYVERTCAADVGFGKETNRIYFYTEFLQDKYLPAIGDKIIAIEGRYGVNQIVKLGHVNG